MCKLAVRMTKRDPPVTMRSVANDDAAFEALFRAEYASLVNFGKRYVHDLTVAEDLVQDVFLALWQLRTRVHPDTAARAYLFRAVRNRALNHLRQTKLRRRVGAELALGARSVEPETGGADVARIRTALQQAIDALPTRCRLIFRMSREHALTYAEIAESLNISIKTVETQMGRALRALRESLERYRP